jgi:hypothetical protein
MDFFDAYLEYAQVGKSEPPASFHRWTALSMLSALIGRNAHLQFGHGLIYPNQYIMLMGSPGTRKSSAINIGIKLLRKAGYKKFSSDKTSKERFLMDMMEIDSSDDDIDDLLDMSVDGTAETYVAIGEFTDFIGHNNMEFVTMLTNLWDCPPVYKNPKIHGKSVEVKAPVVNILGGNTSANFALAFPPEALGNGFLSRLIFVYGDTSGRKVTFPPKPDEDLEQLLVDHLDEIKNKIKGAFSIDAEAIELLDAMYQKDIGIEDVRFKSYATRRFTHLLKIAMLIAASDLRMTVCKQDALKANTILYNAERKMPQALGEFGMSRNSDINNKVLTVLDDARSPMTANDLFKKVSTEVNKLTDLVEVCKNLELAGKIETAKAHGKVGYIRRHEIVKEWDKSLILNDYLHIEELM